jgi:hypothetical protein
MGCQLMDGVSRDSLKAKVCLRPDLAEPGGKAIFLASSLECQSASWDHCSRCRHHDT